MHKICDGMIYWYTNDSKLFTSYILDYRTQHKISNRKAGFTIIFETLQGPVPCSTFF
jgi:hypothetical protein